MTLPMLLPGIAAQVASRPGRLFLGRRNNGVVGPGWGGVVHRLSQQNRSRLVSVVLIVLVVGAAGAKIGRVLLVAQHVTQLFVALLADAVALFIDELVVAGMLSLNCRHLGYFFFVAGAQAGGLVAVQAQVAYHLVAEPGSAGLHRIEAGAGLGFIAGHGLRRHPLLGYGGASGPGQ